MRWYFVGGDEDWEAIQRYNSSWVNDNEILIQNQSNRAISGYVSVSNTALETVWSRRPRLRDL